MPQWIARKIMTAVEMTLLAAGIWALLAASTATL